MHRALPDAWKFARPEDVHSARLELATSALSKALTHEQVSPLADSLTEIVDGLDFAGKPLAASHASMAPPDDELGRFWLANAVLREYRGDCHIAVLITAGLNGVDANVLNVAAGRTFPQQQEMRGWSDEQWAAGQDRLRERGWLDADAVITEAGTAARNQLEEATDLTCHGGVEAEAAVRATDVADGLRAAARAVRDSLKPS